ncbi:MAG: hypothetical protein JWN70_4675 [Planctomycetaceae bacterium]|nr:hypothetical protein [Planctomycetaceae bacterium]
MHTGNVWGSEMSCLGVNVRRVSRYRVEPCRGVLKGRSVPGVLLILLLAAIPNGCQRHVPTAQVDVARKNLQLNRPQLAIEALTKEDSAEGHYLRAVALQAKGERAAAREQIDEALSISPEEIKYKAYQNLLDVLAHKPGSAQHLIELYDVHSSSPAVAFFATRAFVAQHNLQGAVKSFKLGLTLVDEVPEFMFQALQHAVTTEQDADTRQLLKKLEGAAPNDAEFLRELLNIAVKAKLAEPAQHLFQRVQTLTPESLDLPELQVKMELLLGRPEAALVAAHKALEGTPNQSGLELLLAESILRCDPKPERERELVGLVAKHPDNPDFISRHANYLVKNKRLPEALAVLNKAIAQTKVTAVRATLLNMVIRTPIEANAPGLAEQQLTMHQAKFTNPAVADYFMGRILYLKHDYAGALVRFQKVVTSQGTAPTDAGRALAAECLYWQRQILANQLVDERLKAAQEELKKISQPPTAKEGKS